MTNPFEVGLRNWLIFLLLGVRNWLILLLLGRRGIIANARLSHGTVVIFLYGGDILNTRFVPKGDETDGD